MYLPAARRIIPRLIPAHAGPALRVDNFTLHDLGIVLTYLDYLREGNYGDDPVIDGVTYSRTQIITVIGDLLMAEARA